MGWAIQDRYGGGKEWIAKGYASCKQGSESMHCGFETDHKVKNMIEEDAAELAFSLVFAKQEGNETIYGGSI